MLEGSCDSRSYVGVVGSECGRGERWLLCM